MGRALGGSLAAAVLLLTACGTDASPTAASDASTTSPDRSASSGKASSTPSDTPSASASAESAPATPAAPPPAPDGPPFPESTDPQTAEPEGDWDLQLVDVRLGEHDGFDRVVLELSGTTVPGWGVAWSKEAVADGSGDVVPLEGDRVLTISASGTAMPEPGSFEVPARLGPAGSVAEVQVTGWFEGYTQVFAGVEGAERPFRVFTLTDPPRLVVDIADAAD
jgi:hypothetical protein